MSALYLPPPASRATAAPTLRSLARFRVQYRRGLDALTGQTATLTRASTATLIDSAGATVTVGHAMPRYEARTWIDDAAVGLRLSADDLTYPCEWPPETGTLYVALSEAGTRTTANAGLVAIVNDGVSDARLVLDSDGSNYRATLHNGTTSASVTASSVAPTTGQPCEIALQLDDDGTDMRVRMILAIPMTAGEEITAWSSAITRAAAWGSGAKLRLNRTGSAGTQGSTWLRDVAWFPGLVSLDDARGCL